MVAGSIAPCEASELRPRCLLPTPTPCSFTSMKSPATPPREPTPLFCSTAPAGTQPPSSTCPSYIMPIFLPSRTGIDPAGKHLAVQARQLGFKPSLRNRGLGVQASPGAPAISITYEAAAGSQRRSEPDIDRTRRAIRAYPERRRRTYRPTGYPPRRPSPYPRSRWITPGDGGGPPRSPRCRL
jgi:hypothetical protein